MPYGSSIAVGTVCGLIGITTFAVGGASSGAARRGTADHAPANQAALPVTAAAATPAMEFDFDHLPPARMPSELAGSRSTVRNVAVSTDAVGRLLQPAVDAGTRAVRLPVGKSVRLTLLPAMYFDGGERSVVTGELKGVDDQWVELRIGGVETFIERRQVVAIAIEPTTPPAPAVASAGPVD